MANEQKMHTVEIATILSSRTKEGMVEFTFDEHKTQWDIAKAKEIHRMLGEAIEAAISDTLIYKFMVERIGFDDKKASMVLFDFRELRQGSKEAVRPL